MDTSPVSLGPFVLDRRIGRGGMSEVWRAVHPDDEVVVAVKVLTGERARRPRSIRQFRQEARAVARLDHPHIVAVHDMGEVTAEAAEYTHGALEAGAPYLVMDQLPGGSLWKYRGRLVWPDLHNLLHVLLDALAHAHSRGVIHRDLKPSNVLLSAERRAVICDFGLAHLPEADAVLLRAGTPSYMAPEQFRDQWRDFGPWTDLYGFGCLVWTLVAGAPPFRRATWEDTRRAHLEEDLPSLQSLQPMPQGLEDWLRSLLHKDPARRVQYAADAIWALEQLEPDDIDDSDLEPMVEPDDSLDIETTGAMHFGRPPAFSPVASGVGRNDAPPPPPEDWRGPRPMRRLHLRGTGLGLLGARAVPTIGREVERDVLWRALVTVHRLPLARAVLLEGASGTGKTHLGRWLCQQAHEAGAACSLWVEHSREGGGLSGMLRTHFGTDGIPYHQVFERVAATAAGYGTVDPNDQRILAEMVLDDSAAGLSTASWTTAGLSSESSASGTPERIAALSRHLCAVGARRPVILVIDDAHRATDALLFARWLLRKREVEPTPVLLVILAQDEALAHHGPGRDLVAQLSQCDGVDRLRVDALSDEEQLQLIRELVGLEGELARRVAARTAGNPAFAVALLEDWVAKGVLVQAEGGFRLRDGAVAQLPDDLHTLWAAHLEQALAEYPEEVWEALELAAVLGMRIDTEEWLRVAAPTEMMASLDAVDALLARRMVVSTVPAESWRFVHPMVRESLLRRSDDGGRLAGLHQLVLADLEKRPAVDDQRMARHLLGAHRPAEAVRRLMHAARALFALGNPHATLDLCDQAEAAIGTAPDLWARWRRTVALQRARALLLLGRLDEAESAARGPAEDPAASLVESHEGRIVLATIRYLRGELERARDELRDLVRATRDAGLEELLARSLCGTAVVSHHLGDLEGSLTLATEARRLAQNHQDWPTWAEGTTQLASSLAELGHLREAGKLVDEGLAARNRILHPPAIARFLNLAAEIERRKGYPERAVPLYEEALDMLDRMGSLEAAFPRLSLAITHALDGRYAESWRLAERCRRETALQRRPPLELAVRAVLLVSALGLSDRPGWEQQAARILELGAEGVSCEPDGYALIGLGVNLLRGIGDNSLADALSEVVVRWAYGRGQAHAAEVASLLGR
jgi:serine/threonine protein kinase/tetratricopeptide (TPR) repeat protein